jgi:hypothetical protein
VRAAPGAFCTDTDEREAYAAWLEASWLDTATLLEFTAEIGLIGASQIGEALSANERGDARPLYRLSARASQAIADHLNAQMADLIDPEQRGALAVGVTALYGEDQGVAAAGLAQVRCRLPFLTLTPDLACVCYRACVLMCETLGIDVTAYWPPDQLFWSLAERLDAFAELPVAVRQDPVTFHAECVRESGDMGLFWEGAQSVGDAGNLAAKLEECIEARARWESFILEQTQAQPLDLDQVEAQAAWLTENLDEAPERAWAQWVQRVCKRLRKAAGRCPAAPQEPDEGYWRLDALLMIDPGVPWFESAIDELLDHAAQAGESMLDFYRWEPGCARAILDALENLADAMVLILSAPTPEDAGHGTL